MDVIGTAGFDDLFFVVRYFSQKLQLPALRESKNDFGG